MLNVFWIHVEIDDTVGKKLNAQTMNWSNHTFGDLVGFVDGLLEALHDLEEVVGGWLVPIESFGG